MQNRSKWLDFYQLSLPLSRPRLSPLTRPGTSLSFSLFVRALASVEFLLSFFLSLSWWYKCGARVLCACITRTYVIRLGRVVFHRVCVSRARERDARAFISHVHTHSRFASWRQRRASVYVCGGNISAQRFECNVPGWVTERISRGTQVRLPNTLLYKRHYLIA